MFFEPSVCGRPYLYSDSAASSVSSRIVAALTMHLQPAILEETMKQALVRFPQMAVSAVPHGDKYVFEPAKGPLKLFQAYDPDQPSCFGDPELGGYLFKVSYTHKTVYFDFHKSLADEYGMMTFVKSVLFRYFELCGYPVENDGTIKLMSGSFFPAEGDDPMDRLEDIPASRPVWYMDADAIRPKEKISENDIVATVRIPLAKLGKGFEDISRTPVTYIAPFFSQAVSEMFQGQESGGKYVVASIMVNLRPYFPAASLRPFCTPVYLAYNRKLSDYPYNTVLMSQKKLLEAQLKTDALAYSAERTSDQSIEAVDMSTSLEQCKSRVAKMLEDRASMSTYSVCRVGNTILPDSMQRLITDFYPVIPSGKQAFAMSVVVYRGEIVVTVSGSSDTLVAARRFAQLMCSNGIEAYLSDVFDYMPMRYHP